jgi:hypothetical protein
MIGTGNDPAIPAIEADQGLTTCVLGLDDGSTTRALGLGEDPTIRLQLADTHGQPTGQTTGVATLLFGLSLATALPPSALLMPSNAALPVVRSDAHPILSSIDLEAALGRPTMEVGRGRVALEEVDRRMRRLVVSLAVFQVTDGSGALISLGVVTPHWTASGNDGATITDLWALAREALPRHGIAWRHSIRGGGDALLVVYGGVTAQVAWLAGDRLATASVTSLDGSENWTVEAACSIAVLLDRRLGDEDPALGRSRE